MSEELVYIPGEDDNFVALSRTPQGTLFKKHILSEGPLYYGGKTINVTHDFLVKMADNFEKKYCPIVQVPVVDDNNKHTEDPFRNIGEVVKVEVEGDKAYAIIDVRDEKAAPLIGKTLLGASALLSPDYTDRKTMKKVGPTLVHTAITNNPYVSDLEEFEAVRLSVADDSSSKAVILTAARNPKESKMDLDEIIAVLRDEHKIDLPELQKAAGKAETFAALSAQLQEKLTEGEDAVLKLSAADETASDEDIVAAVADLVQSRIELSDKVNTLVEESRTAKAEALVDEKVAAGFILPAKRDAFLNLYLKDAEAFEAVLPEKPLVALSAESGLEIKDDSHDVTVNDEIARLTADAIEQGLIRA